MTKAAQTDPFFEEIHDVEWNACIGVQGSVENYVDGYIEAAQELASTVIDKRMIGSRDTLAMPILYNARHALELSLKFAIEKLHALGMVPALTQVNHDIAAQWKHLNDGGIGDGRLKALLGDVEPT